MQFGGLGDSCLTHSTYNVSFKRTVHSVLEFFHPMQYRRLGMAKLIQHMSLNEQIICEYPYFPLLGRCINMFDYKLQSVGHFDNAFFFLNSSIVWKLNEV